MSGPKATAWAIAALTCLRMGAYSWPLLLANWPLPLANWPAGCDVPPDAGRYWPPDARRLLQAAATSPPLGIRPTPTVTGHWVRHAPRRPRRRRGRRRNAVCTALRRPPRPSAAPAEPAWRRTPRNGARPRPGRRRGAARGSRPQWPAERGPPTHRPICSELPDTGTRPQVRSNACCKRAGFVSSRLSVGPNSTQHNGGVLSHPGLLALGTIMHGTLQ